MIIKSGSRLNRAEVQAVLTTPKHEQFRGDNPEIVEALSRAFNRGMDDMMLWYHGLYGWLVTGSVHLANGKRLDTII